MNWSGRGNSPWPCPTPRTDAWEESARRCWRIPPTLAGWRSGRAARASSRTLARLFLSELGVTFVHWRHQVRLAAALPRLAAGEAVARIAVDLGYQTPSAFSAMFRRLTGSTPSRYFALSDSA